MQTEIKKDVLVILNRIVDILLKREIRDIIELKRLSNSTIDNASIFQDQDSVSIGILVYALAKVFERDFHSEKLYNKIFKLMECARDSLAKDDIDNYRICIRDIFRIIKNVDSRLKMFIEQVLDKVKIQRGSRIFAQGISLARVADMLNITRWELMSYVGKTRIADTEYPGIPVKERLKLVRALFK